MRAGSRRVEFAPGEFPALLGLTALAIYACVPETDQMPTIGWMIAGLFMVEFATRAPSAPAVNLLAAGIVLWSGLYGATGRGSAIVGTWFAFWPVVLVIGSVLLARSRPPQRWVIGLVGALAAIAVARTGAIEPTTAPAVIAVVIAAPTSVIAVWLVTVVSARRGVPASRR
jgi:hypothetical protein